MQIVNSKEKLLIIGASGHGKVVADIALRMNRWNYIAFLDDKVLNSSMTIDVIGKSSDAFTYCKDYDIFVAIGNNTIRETIQTELELAGATIPILIHPNAILGEQVEIAIGSVIMAGVVINCCSKIGKGCIINTGSSLDHDNNIDDFVHISPGVHLAGTVKVGKSTWIGIGSTVSNNINITSNCIMGAGAVVVKNITEAGIYVGIPAKNMKKEYLRT